MDRKKFTSSISCAWRKVEYIKLAETFSNGGSLDVDIAFRDLILNPESKYEDIFLLGLTQSHYNFLLSDHSYFQFSWSQDNDVRYAFYPNPFIGSNVQQLETYKKRQELVAAELINYEDYLRLIDDSRGQGKKPVLRYENAPSQYKSLVHPCSHFHIGLHGDDRWAVRRILSPLAFTLIILRNYYGHFWNAHGETNIETGFNILEEELISERQTCRLVDDSYFSAMDDRTFYFA